MNSVKTKAIGVVMGVISLLVSYHIFFVINEYDRDLEVLKNNFTKHSEAMPVMLETTIKNEYILISKMLMSNENIMKAFRDRDREKLFNLMDLLYKKALISSNDSLKVFHFYLPNNQSFLRMQKPSMHSDFANDRPTVVEVNKNKELISGYEVGKFGFYYRVEIPIFYESEYLGMLDIGIDFMSILNKELNTYSKNENYLSLLVKEQSSNILLNKEDKVKAGSYVLEYTNNELFKRVFENNLITDIQHEYKADGESYILY